MPKRSRSANIKHRRRKTVAASSDVEASSSRSSSPSHNGVKADSELDELEVEGFDINALDDTTKEYVRKLQCRANMAALEVKSHHRKTLGDRTNGQDGSDHSSRKKIKQFDESEITKVGKCLAATRLLWVRGREVPEGKLDPEYDSTERFETATAKVQGQLYDILDVLPDELSQAYKKKNQIAPEVIDIILSAMGRQRSDMAHRVRTDIGPVVFNISKADMKDPETRACPDNKELAGLTLSASSEEYSAFDVPLLHSNFASKFDKHTIFLNPLLIEIYSGIIRGPSSTVAMKKKLPVAVAAETMVQVWRLDSITPGGIAAAAILARWCLSADSKFQDKGGATNIHWAKDFHAYLEYLTNGLQRKKQTVLKIFREWNDTLFPGTEHNSSDTNGGPGPMNKRTAREAAALDALDEDSAASESGE